jgi:hypothetical protein
VVGPAGPGRRRPVRPARAAHGPPARAGAGPARPAAAGHRAGARGPVLRGLRRPQSARPHLLPVLRRAPARRRDPGGPATPGPAPSAAAARLQPPAAGQRPPPAALPQPPWGHAGYQGLTQGRTPQSVRRIQPRRRFSVSRLAPLLVILSLLGVSLSPARQWAVTKVQAIFNTAHRHFSEQYVNESPVSASASSAAPGHPAQAAIDGNTATYWLTKGPAGLDSSFTVHFATPVDITRIGILSGEPGVAYLTQARPETVALTAGTAPPVAVTFTDTAGFQTQPVTLTGVTVLTLTIQSDYAGQQGQAVAIRELQFSRLATGTSASPAAAGYPRPLVSRP